MASKINRKFVFVVGGFSVAAVLLLVAVVLVNQLWIKNAERHIRSGDELMARFAGLELLPHRTLPAVGLVVARGVVGEERAVVAGDEVAAQDREGRGVREGFRDVGAERGASGGREAVELVPVAVELVEIQGALEAEGTCLVRRST